MKYILFGQVASTVREIDRSEDLVKLHERAISSGYQKCFILDEANVTIWSRSPESTPSLRAWRPA